MFVKGDHMKVKEIMDTKPEFMIIGAAKSGTSSLAHFLNLHPAICPSTQKEVHFFDNPNNYHQGPEFYAKFFDKSADNAKLKQNCSHFVDATPAYIRDPEIPSRLAAFFPPEILRRKKFILVLRDPTSRDCSWYNHISGFCVMEVRDKLERNVTDPSYLCADKRSDSGVPHCGQMGCREHVSNISIDTVNNVVFSLDEYIKTADYERYNSYYDVQLANWLTVVNRRQLFIVNMESLLHNTTEVAHSMFRFLGIDPYAIDPISFPHTNPHHRNGCSCSGLESIHRAHERRGTTNKTNAIVNKLPKAHFEPVFYLLRDDAIVHKQCTVD